MKVIVVGGGQVGRYISSLLLSNGHEIKVIARVNNPKNAWLFNSGMGNEAEPRGILHCSN